MSIWWGIGRGLITTLAVEKYPDLFSGGLALCGPIGDFRGQVDYWGDFRVVFDYFFPEVLPPSPVTIPSVVIENWGNQYAPAIIQAIALGPHATEQLLSVTQASVDPSDSASISETVLGVLWYNVFATNEAIIELNGQPFDNRKRRYLGSDDDKALKKGVERFKADRSALAGIATYYQTSGLLTKPWLPCTIRLIQLCPIGTKTSMAQRCLQAVLLLVRSYPYTQIRSLQLHCE